MLNQGYNWRPGYRSNPCSESYPGKEAFDSKELQGVRDYILDSSNHVAAFLDVHSFGQLLMFPFASDCSKVAKDAENLYEAGLGAAKAVKASHGRQFEVSVCVLKSRKS